MLNLLLQIGLKGAFLIEMAKESSRRRDKFGFPPWIPVTASLALMVAVAYVAGTNLKRLNDVTQWRRHSADVILTEQSFQKNLLDIQRGWRGYVTIGDTNALASYYNNVSVEPQQFKELELFTTDNVQQENRLRELADAMTSLIAYDDRAITVYRREGFAGISKMDATGEGREVFGRAQDLLSKFLADEQRLWDVRDASEQEEYHNAGQLLIAGSLLAAFLLLLATSLAGRELAWRRRAEAKLKETLILQNAILGSADYGIISSDLEGVIQTFNPAAERLLGYTAAEVVGKTTSMIWRDPQEIAQRAADLSKILKIHVKPGFEAIAKKVQTDAIDDGEWTFIRKDGTRFPVFLVVTSLSDETGSRGFIGVFHDISEQKKNEMERERLIAELKETLAHVKTLSGLIPICAWCKNVRSDTGYWQTVEQYVRIHSDANFSHGMCPSCAKKFKDDVHRANKTSEAVPSKT